MSPFYFNIRSLLHVQKALNIFIFTLSLKHHSDDLFTTIFTSSIKFAWELFLIFPVSISSHHKRNWRQFTYARLFGVNKVFYWRGKNCEYVKSFIVLLLFYLFNTSKMCDQHFAKVLTYSRSPFMNCLALFFSFFMDLK